ncbi:MAG: cytochrome c, partial [Phycisphaeraceae bacterium]|nr:cytochrome c [Phycisphaeraceae bacterium]
VLSTARAYLTGKKITTETAPVYATTLTGEAKASFLRGAEVFGRDGHCATCHQADGKGLPAAQFPPLANSEWVSGSKDRLIKLVLHGVVGPLTVQGKKYPGSVPMTPFKHLSDKEVADVLTFVRNSFQNKASMVTSDDVAKVRAATKGQASPFQAVDLLKAHPK